MYLKSSLIPYAKTREQFEGVSSMLDPVAMGKLRKQPPDEIPKDAKTLRVNVVGIPNSGKSTLVNQLVGANICPHSKKVHTTRENSIGVLTDGAGQIVFLDTPGIITLEEKEEFNLEDSLYDDPFDSCLDSDLIVVVHDVSNRFVREAISNRVLKLLCKNPGIPSILVMNKMDTIPKSRRVYDLIRKLTCGQLEGKKESTRVKKNQVLQMSADAYFKKREKRLAKIQTEDPNKIPIRNYDDLLKVLRSDPGSRDSDEMVSDLCKGLIGWPGFRDVFTVCALDGDGVDDLRDYLLYNAKPGDWKYNDKIPTMEDPTHLVVKIIKSKFLDVLQHDIPYKIKPVIQSWTIENGVLRLLISVTSNSHRMTHLLLSHSATNLGKVAKLAENDLQNLFHCDVFVNLTVNISHEEKKWPQPPQEDRITFH